MNCILCVSNVVYCIRIRNVVLVFASGQPTLPYHLLAYQQYSVKAVTVFVRMLSVQGSPHAGRYLVTRTTIPAGHMVLREEALITGPRLGPVLVCVQCLHVMGELRLCIR